MKKYKKIITGLILALICAILPFVGVAEVKALTVDDITTANDLKNTSWILNETLQMNRSGTTIYLKIDEAISSGEVVANYTYGEEVINIIPTSTNAVVELRTILSFGIGGTSIKSVYADYTNNGGFYYDPYGNAPRRLSFGNYNFTQSGDFIGWLKSNATLESSSSEPTTRTIPFKIGVILGNSGTAQTDEIYLPFNDDTVSFSVDFTPTKLINGQISKAPGEDMRELIFQNGKKIFYTVYYNEDNVDFKLNFYGEELQVFLAVMHNTINQDNEGNYLPASQTYTSGLTSTDIDNLNNTGVYSANFEIQIPPEDELVSGHFLELRIGINPYVNDEENNENISNIMTGIFTLISSFLSIQLGFITLGQIIGLVLAIGVIFFIFYVWNGGRNGN